MHLRTKLWLDYYVGGTLLALLKPPTVLLGRLLRRDHRLTAAGDVTIVKLLGGGSLVIAYPSLLALRRRMPHAKLRLLASPATAAFGRTLDLFDEILVVRDASPGTLLLDVFGVLRRLWRTGTLVDLEIHSRLTTVLCLLTCARNRVEFYTQESNWRLNLSTHTLFCHVGNGVFDFYDQLVRLFGATPLPLAEASPAFRAALGLGAVDRAEGDVAVAPCCSDLGRERMLTNEEWTAVLSDFAARRPLHTLTILGGPGDVAYAERLRLAVAKALPGVTVVNAAGTMPLAESVRRLDTMAHLLAIDSALLHYARLLGVPTTSFWGPTDPATRLRPSTLALDVLHYGKLPCSPCVHVVAEPPCRGNNLCMRLAVDADAPVDRNPAWLADGRERAAAPAPAGPD